MRCRDPECPEWVNVETVELELELELVELGWSPRMGMGIFGAAYPP